MHWNIISQMFLSEKIKFFGLLSLSFSPTVKYTEVLAATTSHKHKSKSNLICCLAGAQIYVKLCCHFPRGVTINRNNTYRLTPVFSHSI